MRLLKVYLKSGRIVNFKDNIDGIYEVSILNSKSITTNKIFIPFNNIDYAEIIDTKDLFPLLVEQNI